jgi:hypothetical protein
MIKNILSILIIGIFISSCDFVDCNYSSLNEKEMNKFSELNENFTTIDTIYNDQCLKGFVHVYLKTDQSDFKTEKEIENILSELLNSKMNRDIWVFNNENEFLYRLFYNDSNLNKKPFKTDLQYPNE